MVVPGVVVLSWVVALGERIGHREELVQEIGEKVVEDFRSYRRVVSEREHWCSSSSQGSHSRNVRCVDESSLRLKFRVGVPTVTST